MKSYSQDAFNNFEILVVTSHRKVYIPYEIDEFGECREEKKDAFVYLKTSHIHIQTQMKYLIKTTLMTNHKQTILFQMHDRKVISMFKND